MQILRRLDRMFLVAEFPLWNKKTKQYDIYPGNLRVIPDPKNKQCNDMWYWDRLDRRDWYWTQGAACDQIVWEHIKKK